MYFSAHSWQDTSRSGPCQLLSISAHGTHPIKTAPKACGASQYRMTFVYSLNLDTPAASAETLSAARVCRSVGDSKGNA